MESWRSLSCPVLSSPPLLSSAHSHTLSHSASSAALARLLTLPPLLLDDASSLPCSSMTPIKRRRTAQPARAPAHSTSHHPPHSPTQPSHAHSTAPLTSAPWRRVLFEQQAYPDNYTPGDWSSAISSYSTAPAESSYHSYSEVVWLTLIIANRASILILFITTFYAIKQHAISTRSLFFTIVTVSAVLVGLHYSLCPPASSTSSTQLSLASVCLLCFLLLLVSPLLSTLTWSYSSDTIYLLAFLLSAAHLLSFDYSSINQPTTQPPLAPPTTTTTTTTSTTPAVHPVPPSHDASDHCLPLTASSALSPIHHPVSLNCALLLSLLLASRLSSPLHVSLLLLLSSLLFAVSPSQQQLLRRWSASAHLLSFLLLSLLCCCVLCVHASVLLAVVYVLCVLSVCFVCPWWLLRVQRYKRTIHGPWDYNDEPETSSENL